MLTDCELDSIYNFANVLRSYVRRALNGLSPRDGLVRRLRRLSQIQSGSQQLPELQPDNTLL